MSRTLAISVVFVLALASLFAAPLAAALTPEQETVARRLVRNFGAIEFSVRQAAVDKLVAMGPDVLPIVKETRASATDAEVKLRCDMVIKALARKPARPVVAARIDEKILKVLGPMAYGRTDYWERNRDGDGRVFRFQRDGKWHVCHNDWESAGYDMVGLPVMTPNGKVSAFQAQRDGKWMIVINREEQRLYERVGNLTLSEDGNRSLYGGVRDGAVYVVVDGKEFGPYPMMRAGVGFSADNGHAAWIIARDNKDAFVLDGREGPPHDHVCRLQPPRTEEIGFGAPSRHVCRSPHAPPWTDFRPSLLQRYLAVDNGRVRLVEVAFPKPGADAPLVEREIRVLGEIEADLSKVEHWAAADGLHVVYRTPPGATVWCDGGRLGTWDRSEGVNLSADGRHTAFMAQRGAKHFFVWDGKESSAFDDVYALWLPTVGHYSYAGVRNGKMYCVFDGREDGKGFDAVDERAASKDGRHWAYSAKDGEAWAVVRNGRVIGRHEGVGTMSFDPSGERFAYIAKEGGLQFVVCEGKRGKGFEIIPQGPTFSKDGKHLWYSVKQAGKHFIVVDGISGPTHDGGIEMREGFDGNGVCRYVFVDSRDIENLAEVAWPEGADWTNDLEDIE